MSLCNMCIVNNLKFFRGSGWRHFVPRDILGRTHVEYYNDNIMLTYHLLDLCGYYTDDEYRIYSFSDNKLYGGVKRVAVFLS